MKIGVTIIALIFLYLAIEFGIFWYKYHNLPNLPNIDQSDKTFGSGPTIKYIAAGDSTAVGYGASNTQNTYAYKVAQYLAQSHTVEYKNIAVTGSKTSDILQNQISQIIAYNPDIITISIGANDATHLVTSQHLIENYKSIIQKLEQGTTAKIYITDVANFNGAKLLPWFYVDFLQWRDQSLNKQILALADNRVKIIDIYNFGWDKPPYKDRSQTYAADGFHPNDLGYQNWANAFMNSISAQ